MLHYFSDTYEHSRMRFRESLSNIKEFWPQAGLHSYPIGNKEDNTIDVIKSEAIERNENVVFITTGEHGIEGYTGAAALQMFFEEYLHKLNPETTGVYFVHGINPWGMRHWRRVTENNIDLNRNYIRDWLNHPATFNEDYKKNADLYNPAGEIDDLTKQNTKIHSKLLKNLIKEGYKGVKSAKSKGQYQFEKGVYYGGAGYEDSSKVMMDIQDEVLRHFEHIVHVDLHTGLGPTQELTYVISAYDDRSEPEVSDFYGIKNVQKNGKEDGVGESNNSFTGERWNITRSAPLLPACLKLEQWVKEWTTS
ncbi:DUF2817 domain-containing protein [Bacillus sp. H-16]|nr:M14 family metallopeptidase [Alteribacter salitolerans]MBM7095448.1 DUF2817 domain-containing protein [Alteribacter salitolerans]